MTLARALQVAAGNSQESADVAEAIDFDGTNDTLYRSSLTGAADGKTFTFSAFVWIDTTGSCQIINIQGGSINIFVSGSNTLSMQLSSTSGGTRSITLDTTSLQISLNTWVHILYSADVTSTVTRRLYINDVLVSPTYTDYNNINIDWTAVDVYVGGNSAKWDGRLSSVYLDYTYRDLTDTANRRLFVTADLKPAADQAALNPILYLPLNNPTNPGFNAGTGGNFTLTGTVARSGRGPNQYNAPYSGLDGGADYLSKTTSLTGIVDGKAFTLSFCFNKTSVSNKFPFTIYSSTTKRFRAIVDSGGYITFEAFSSSGTTVLYVSSSAGSIALGRNYVITISVDLTDTAKRHLYINGSAATATWSTYSNTDIDLNPTTPRYYVGYDASPATFWEGDLGAVWFNNSYIDLSQPANLAKFVAGTGIDAKPVDPGANGELPTGTSPLLYLPMYGNNAGRNYGTGGNFTVNSGPYTGARGPNEFWGNKADFDGTTGYLSRTSALSGVSNGKVVSGSFWINGDVVTGSPIIFDYGTSAPTSIGKIDLGSSQLRFFLYDLGTTRMSLTATTTTIGAGTGYFVQYCFDLSDTANRYVFINGVQQTLAVTTYVNATIPFSSINLARIGVSAYSPPNNIFNGKLSEFYFTTDYIDFSQEANRLKFRDAFGNPVDLTQQIEDGAIPNPAIYMRFPPTAFGTNYGTGGNFTVNGTITDGGQL